MNSPCFSGWNLATKFLSPSSQIFVWSTPQWTQLQLSLRHSKQLFTRTPWEAVNMPIRYSPMAFYFRVSIIFLTLPILQHPPHRCNLPWPSCEPSRNHHRLYPIPITPSVRYHVGDLWTTLLYFPFLVSSLLPDASFHSPTDHKSLHHVVGTLPYVSPHMNLVLVLLLVCI